MNITPKSTRITSVAGLAVLITFVSVLILSCESPVREPAGNALPTTRLANIPPNDTIARYIAQGAIPEFSLYWVGDDPDGFVIGYRYRWTTFVHGALFEQKDWTTILNLTTIGGRILDTLIIAHGNVPSVFRIYNFFATLDPAENDLIAGIQDSLATGRPFAVPYKSGVTPGDSVVGASSLTNPTPTHGIFIFDSPIDSNMHRFEVSSIDNNDAVDPNPALVNFWTLKSPSPIMQLVAPIPANNQYVIRYPTEELPGLLFRLNALDASTFDFEFSWAVDDTTGGRWSPWSESREALVTALHFSPINADTHIFFVRARNRWGGLSQTLQHKFTAIVPEIDDPAWPRRILVINSNRNGTGVRGHPDSAQYNQFYREALNFILGPLGRENQFDVWTCATPKPGFSLGDIPPLSVLGRYTTVIYLLENRLYTIPPAGCQACLPGFGQGFFSGPKQNLMRGYLRIGGNLVFSGPPEVKTTIQPYDSPTSPGWAPERFHVVPESILPFRQNSNRDFVGAKGVLGYPTIMIDSTKVHADSLGAFRFIALCPPRGFGETISLFDSRTDDPIFENGPLGIRYLAPPPIPPARSTYSVVYFAFPLYFGETASVRAALKKALEDVREIPAQ
jgi:hypothetical protein